VDHSRNFTGKQVRGRPSVRLQSKKTYQGGLFISDIEHMPGSICGVWPAFWTVGANWPNDGEIDIIENVNQNTVNLETLHTNTGCNLVKGDQGGTANGDGVCDQYYSNPPHQYVGQACSVTDNKQHSYGTPFNAIGGGVYAMVSHIR
jgi:hypothetical protein